MGRALQLEEMKTEIHPQYETAIVRCTCGNEFETRSTKPELRVEICSSCHPFYTGRQKLIDTEGRVDKFQKKYAKAKDLKDAKDAADAAKKKVPVA